jgi:putative glutamine amidotransferase
MSLVQVRVSAQYAEAIYQAGGYPLIVPTFTGHGRKYVPGRGWPEPRPRVLKTLKREATDIILNSSGLLLTGGGDILLREEPGAPPDRAMDRDRDFWEAALFEAATRLKRPVFGICRGAQVINVVLGGSLWDDIPSQVPQAIKHQQRTVRTKTCHKVTLEPDSQLAAICGQLELLVNSGHHQAIKDLAPGLKIVGRSSDGLVEAVERDGEPLIFGVQWHPEALIGGPPVYMSLFEALVNAARPVRPGEAPGS